MIAVALSVLFTIVAAATLTALTDCALRVRSAIAGLKHQQALIDAGFVRQVEARSVRLRGAQARAVACATRPFAQRLPHRSRTTVRSYGAA